MSFEDILPSEDLSKTCVVCGKSLHPRYFLIRARKQGERQ
jgi:hypothetical protein